MYIETKDSIIETKPRWGVIVWLAISQLLAVGSLIPWLVYAIMSYFAVVNNGGYSVWEVLFVSVTFAYPVVVVVCAIRAWLLYRAHKDRQALIVTSLFLIIPIFYFMTVYVTTLFR